MITKIKKLEEQFIATPFELPSEYKKERNIREQKLSFMESNYRHLEDEVGDMKNQLVELRRKYKAASKEIFQLENDHEKEREIVREEFDTIKQESIMMKSVLNVLFTEKQLKNIMSLGEWQGNNKFKLPSFYFKDRHTLAFPCEEKQNEPPQSSTKDYSSEKFNTTATSFATKMSGPSVGRGIVFRRR